MLAPVDAAGSSPVPDPDDHPHARSHGHGDRYHPLGVSRPVLDLPITGEVQQREEAETMTIGTVVPASSWLGAIDLVRSAQVPGAVSSAQIRQAVADADAAGSPAAAMMCMYAGVLGGRYSLEIAEESFLDQLLERAEREDDPVMTALALASRASDPLGDDRPAIDSDQDLARASVLLDGVPDDAPGLLPAHVQCALAWAARDLWELALRHLGRAVRAADVEGRGEHRLAAVRYNIAEIQLNWLVSLRELSSHHPHLGTQADRVRSALADAERTPMPQSWYDDLRAFRHLVEAIVPSGSTPPPLHDPEAEFVGYVHLSEAMRETDLGRAGALARSAIVAIDPQVGRGVRMLGFAVAAEIESATNGAETAGLQWGRQLAAQQWERRLANLASMERLLTVIRNGHEREQLRQAANCDPLTGLANRRGLAEYLAGLRAAGVERVALAVVDLDHFKGVNDTYGHAVGDAVLVRLAELLSSGVRADDLVVRLGGDEVVVVLRLADDHLAEQRCHALVDRVRAATWSDLGADLQVTISVGLALGSPAELDRLTVRADEALYRSKAAGRDRASVADPVT